MTLCRKQENRLKYTSTYKPYFIFLINIECTQYFNISNVIRLIRKQLFLGGISQQHVNNEVILPIGVQLP